MNIKHLSAFSHNGQGGNPAGVLIADTHPTVPQMQAIAKELNYSESVFASPDGDQWHARYFAPESEVPFCGHATIALGAALGQSRGAGDYTLSTAAGPVGVTAFEHDGNWGAELTSPPAHHSAPSTEQLEQGLALFGLTQDDLDPDLPPVLAHAGAKHLIFAVKSRAQVTAMAYDQTKGAEFMRALNLITITITYRESPTLFHSRNPFASGGVYEDPATGAAAAALGGWLRDSDRQSNTFVIEQGVDMGVPSHLTVTPLPTKGAGVKVRGLVRTIT